MHNACCNAQVAYLAISELFEVVSLSSVGMCFKFDTFLSVNDCYWQSDSLVSIDCK